LKRIFLDNLKNIINNLKTKIKKYELRRNNNK